MDTVAFAPCAPAAAPHDQPAPAAARPVGGPVRAAWAEGTLTRAKELESLSAWVCQRDRCQELANAIDLHLQAAREAAWHQRRWALRYTSGALIERAMSNLDAAEAQLLNAAPADYVLGQMPSLLNHVQRHLLPTDPRRQAFEQVACKLGVKDPDHPSPQDRPEQTLDDKRRKLEEERGKIATAARAASSAALREQLRVRSFRNVLVATAGFMTLLAAGVAVMGFLSPTTIPLCFQPEKSGQTVVVCPTAQTPLVTGGEVDDAIKNTAGRGDLLIVELVGLTAASVAAAAAIRGIRGSSEPHGLPVALAALKLPTGAITAFLGLLLMRGQFVPGLSALDSSGQILAWALVFGYAQQLFTRLVDQQAHTVLDTVRGANKRDRAGPSPVPVRTEPRAYPPRAA